MKTEGDGQSGGAPFTHTFCSAGDCRSLSPRSVATGSDLSLSIVAPKGQHPRCRTPRRGWGAGGGNRPPTPGDALAAPNRRGYLPAPGYLAARLRLRERERAALLQVMRCRRCRRAELFLIVQVPVGAVVRQRRGVRRSRSLREGSGGGGAARERQRERERQAGRSNES